MASGLTATTPIGTARHGTAPGALRRHGNLVRELAVTQFRLKYTGSVLGYLWSLLKPAMIFGVNYAVFARLLKAGSLTVNFPLQLLVGIVLWSFFAETIGTAISAVAGNGHIIRKAYFPRSILVISSSLTAMLTFLINISLIVVIAGALGRLDFGMHSLVMIPLVLELYVLILGIALLLSALFVFYRDLGHIWEVSSQVLFYGSAIVYPFVLVPDGVRTLVACNPIAQIVEDARHALVASDPDKVPWTASVLGWRYAVPLFASVALLAVGSAVFRLLSPRFAENL